ncbi:MAG: glycosyltransferase family 2 protein [Alphaproteobacteria bacterium]|nr:glycosyltransferase family 2 protein [Alphaproteobacteria bacterium]
MPEISVIIPCYNQEKYIAECLESVLAQTFKDYEIIVINDGSTDNSEEIIKKYMQKHPEIKLISQENKGLVAARNTAIAQSSGKYFYPLDGDDKIHPQCLEKLYTVITSTKNRVVASNVKVFDKKDELFLQPHLTKYEMYGKHECCVVSALYYKEDFISFGGYKTEFSRLGGEDMDYWLNYIDRGLPIIRLPDILFYYRVKEEKSYWQDYASKEMQLRMQQKLALLIKYHPQMRFWLLFYHISRKLVRLFYRQKTKEQKIYYKILGITIYKKTLSD